MNGFDEEIAALKSAGLFRSLRTVEPIDGGRLRVDGREVVSFAGNDYLGLRRHPAVVSAAKAGIETYGAGAGASRLLAGTTPVHVELEAALARFTRRPRALVFPSGYQTNLGVLGALAGDDDVLLLDRLCHASLFDAARLSKADRRVYPHLDPEGLEGLLRKHAGARRRFVVTEGVFSMDGDVAPLAEIVRLADRHDAWLILDDAHALGVLGETGRGTSEHLGVALGERTVCVATLSKALGSQGGFAAGPPEVIDLLVNRARSFIYTTGLSPGCASAALAALDLVTDPAPRRHLLELSRLARRTLRQTFPDVPEGVTPIIPVVVGEVEETLVLSSRLFEAGVFAPAIRPPTVPTGTARLRISLSTDHTPADVDRLAETLRQARRS
ncbi:MAG TPA: 8-amino-7-oxononanoate synthase [Planctomycetota bacterium]|nr:8-amino-7-oxononanoate synthase [Planctomycetota bacterium]